MKNILLPIIVATLTIPTSLIAIIAVNSYSGSSSKEVIFDLSTSLLILHQPLHGMDGVREMFPGSKVVEVLVSMS